MLNHSNEKKSGGGKSRGEGAGSSGKHLTDNRSRSSPAQRKVNNTGLPDNLKAGMENLSGHSLDDVKVFYNSPQPAQLNAHAYAQGTDIHIAPGQEKHLPHEAWHVVQQKQGRVKPTMQMKGKVNVNDDAGLEKEADLMGRLSLQHSLQNPETAQLKLNADLGHAVVQRLTNAQRQAINQRIARNQGIANGHKNTINAGRRRGWLLRAGLQRATLQTLIAALNASIAARESVQVDQATLGHPDVGGGHAARIVNERALLALADAVLLTIGRNPAGPWVPHPHVPNRERRQAAYWDRDPIHHEERDVVAAADAADGWQPARRGVRRR